MIFQIMSDVCTVCLVLLQGGKGKRVRLAFDDFEVTRTIGCNGDYLLVSPTGRWPGDPICPQVSGLVTLYAPRSVAPYYVLGHYHISQVNTTYPRPKQHSLLQHCIPWVHCLSSTASLTLLFFFIPFASAVD